MRAELLVDAFYNHSLLSPLKLHIFRKGHSSGCHVRISIELLLCMGLWWLFSRDTPIAESTTLPVSASWNFMAWPMSIKDACSVITQLPKAGELRLFFIIPSPHHYYRVDRFLLGPSRPILVSALSSHRTASP